jgi:hypothetical protein
MDINMLTAAMAKNTADKVSTALHEVTLRATFGRILSLVARQSEKGEYAVSDYVDENCFDAIASALTKRGFVVDAGIVSTDGSQCMLNVRW